MKMSVQREEEYSEFEIELAKRNLCATVSMQLGITYQHCWKTYIEPNLKKRKREPCILNAPGSSRKVSAKKRKPYSRGRWLDHKSELKKHPNQT